MSEQPPRPNSSRLLRQDKNRKTGDKTWTIDLPPVFRAAFACDPDLFREVRKRAVREREYWQAEKKSAGANRDAAQWAKQEERMWMQRERAANLLCGWADGNTPQQLETYYWPVELAPALEWAISETPQ